MVFRRITLVPYPEKGSCALRPKTERDHELVVHLTGGICGSARYKPNDPVFLFEPDDSDWLRRLAEDHGWAVIIERQKEDA